VRANAARALAHRGEPGLQRLARTLDTNDNYARDAALSALTAAGAEITSCRDERPPIERAFLAVTGGRAA
jgi:hypothetical protein